MSAEKAAGKAPWKAAGKAVRNNAQSNARNTVRNNARKAAGKANGKMAERAAAPAEGESLRLNKAIAQSGVCSRRKADELIAQGRVKVNGLPAAEGQRVLPGDQVTVDGQPLGASEELVAEFVNRLLCGRCTRKREDRNPDFDDTIHRRFLR